MVLTGSPVQPFFEAMYILVGEDSNWLPQRPVSISPDK